MFLTDYIRIYDDAMSHQCCDAFIQTFESSPDTEEIVVADPQEGRQPLRSSIDCVISAHQEFAVLHGAMVHVVDSIVARYQSDVMGKLFPQEFGIENIKMRKYRCGQDHFSYHTDVADYDTARRFVSIIWFLNDVEVGGEAVFPHPLLRIRPRKGRLVMFPSVWMYPHLIEQPHSNDCFVLETYLHYL